MDKRWFVRLIKKAKEIRGKAQFFLRSKFSVKETMSLSFKKAVGSNTVLLIIVSLKNSCFIVSGSLFISCVLCLRIKKK